VIREISVNNTITLNVSELVRYPYKIYFNLVVPSWIKPMASLKYYTLKMECLNMFIPSEANVELKIPKRRLL